MAGTLPSLLTRLRHPGPVIFMGCGALITLLCLWLLPVLTSLTPSPFLKTFSIRDYGKANGSIGGYERISTGSWFEDRFELGFGPRRLSGAANFWPNPGLENPEKLAQAIIDRIHDQGGKAELRGSGGAWNDEEKSGVFSQNIQYRFLFRRGIITIAYSDKDPHPPGEAKSWVGLSLHIMEF